MRVGEIFFACYPGHSALKRINILRQADSSTIYKAESIASDQQTIQAWLQETSEFQGQSIASILLVDVNRLQPTTPSETSIIRQAFEGLSLSPPILSSFKACRQGFVSFPLLETPRPPVKEQKFCFSAGSWAISWSTLSDGSRSRAIALVQNPQWVSDISGLLERTLEKLQHHINHPCYVGFVAAAVALTHVSRKLSTIDAYAGLKSYELRVQFIGSGQQLRESLSMDTRSIGGRSHWVFYSFQRHQTYGVIADRASQAERVIQRDVPGETED